MDVEGQESRVESQRIRLAAAGYRVARLPFNVCWFASSGPDYRQPTEEASYSIDLVRGVFVRWGEPPVERPIEKLLTAGQQEHKRVEQLGPFIDRCVSRGFTLDDALNDRSDHTIAGVDTGSRFARWHGQLMLLHAKTETIIDRRFNKHTLNQLAPVTAPRREVEYSGRSAQPSLF